VERGESAPRLQVPYYCNCGRVTTPSFALSDDLEVPLEWDCTYCGFPAGLDKANPPEAIRHEPYKTHLAYVKERRTEQEGQALLDEALDALRVRRSG